MPLEKSLERSGQLKVLVHPCFEFELRYIISGVLMDVVDA